MDDMKEAEAVRSLHRIIDRRIEQAMGASRAVELARGEVASVDAENYRLTAYLDGADAPTHGIAYDLSSSPVVGDDIVVLRRRDGFLLLAAIVGRD